MAITKYKQFSRQMMQGGRATPLDVNNQFFNQQIKTEREAILPPCK